MIVHSAYDWHEALVASARTLATLRGEDPDAAEVQRRATIAAAPDLPWHDDSGCESADVRRFEAAGGWSRDADDRAADDYERWLG